MPVIPASSLLLVLPPSIPPSMANSPLSFVLFPLTSPLEAAPVPPSPLLPVSPPRPGAGALGGGRKAAKRAMKSSSLSSSSETSPSCSSSPSAVRSAVSRPPPAGTPSPCPASDSASASESTPASRSGSSSSASASASSSSSSSRRNCATTCWCFLLFSCCSKAFSDLKLFRHASHRYSKASLAFSEDSSSLTISPRARLASRLAATSAQRSSSARRAASLRCCRSCASAALRFSLPASSRCVCSTVAFICCF
mmetsp:Transcript_97368/g.270841  ORF Transcript_97368/g.270841 Transcript_97368/m.270841 type:complete len:253 (-) Transcript_97368:782-1540(-)